MDLISFAPRKAANDSRAEAAARIKDWATNEFASAGFSVNNDSARLMVSEVECMMPGCVPLETVIVLLREGHAATKTKILHPMAQVQRSHVRGAAFSLAASERLRDALARELDALSSKLTTPVGRPPFGGADADQDRLEEDPQHALQVLEQLGFALQKHDDAIRPKFLAQYGHMLRADDDRGDVDGGAATGNATGGDAAGPAVGPLSAALQACAPSVQTPPATAPPAQTSTASTLQAPAPALQAPSPTPQKSTQPASTQAAKTQATSSPSSTIPTAMNSPTSSAVVQGTASASASTPSPAPSAATAPSSVSKRTVMEAQDLIMAGSIEGIGGGAAAARAASSADGPPRRNPNHKGPYRPGGCPCCDPLGNEIDNILAGKGWY